MDLIRNNEAGLDGLSQLHEMIAAGMHPPIAVTLGFTLAEVEKGRVVFEGTPGKHVLNPIGTVHGGYAATILDSACGCAAHSMLTSTQGYTTLELKVSYHRALYETSGRVTAEGKVLSSGRRVAFAEAKLFDVEGRLCVSATSTLLVFELDKDAGKA
ncbi:MAG: PaaI family thioesterase [Hyphomicrobiales bacterium]|nr:PaaI family thioesterase [Hyphomicrobiales bacterium]